MRARAFIVPKGAESDNDCQDRFSINAATGSVAVSDGMSQSLFPKYWAEILADRYTSERDWFPSHENVRALSQIWREMVEARLEAMRRNGINTWRTENMLADGMSAGATLVGVRTTDTGWECNVLGDSCLVVVKEDRIDVIHSSMDTGSFGNYPDYYDSDPAKPGKGEVATFDGHWAKGLTLLLVSDPLAAYLASVRGSDKEAVCIRELLSVESADEFKILVDYWRKKGMHDDDTTMAVVTNDYEWMDSLFLRQAEWVW